MLDDDTLPDAIVEVGVDGLVLLFDISIGFRGKVVMGMEGGCTMWCSQSM
jgi:hypothetical protein